MVTGLTGQGRGTVLGPTHNAWRVLATCLVALSLTVSCRSRIGSRGAQSFPDAPIAVHSGDCVWLLDAGSAAVAYGPLCLSGLIRQVGIGDVEVTREGLVYVGVKQEFNPEKELGKEVVLWDPVAHRTSKCEIPAGSRMLAHDSDREVLYVTSRHAPIVSVVDLRTLAVVDTLEYDASADYGRDIVVGLTGEVYVAAWRDLVTLTPDSSQLAGTMRTFEGWIEGILPCGNDSLCVIFDTFVEVVAKRDLVTTTSFRFGLRTTDLAALPSGDLLIVLRGGDAVHMYDPETGTVRSLAIPGGYGRVAGTWEAIVCFLSTDGKQVFLVDTSTGEVSEPIDLPRR